jgi:predicted DNA-binding transcriptional regulator AlpA
LVPEKFMLRKIDKAEPLESAPKSAAELNCLERLLTPREAADFLRASDSWLAKARMRGDGPPFVKIGRSIRYRQSDLLRWMRFRTHLSTSEHD